MTTSCRKIRRHSAAAGYIDPKAPDHAGCAGLGDDLQRESEVQIQLLLAAAIKHSPLLGDFIFGNVYTMRQRGLESTVVTIA